MAVIALMLTISASVQFYIYCSDGNVIMVDSISMVAPEEPEEPTPPAGIGVFSVSANKQVTFSSGNLQYHPANDEWRFAPSQLDYIGDANINISPTYNGWLDSFGWGTGNNPTNSSKDYNDYQTFVDWGTNQIGSDAPNTWRTLTYDEWKYLLNTRANASSLKGVAQVNGVNGLILLPDNWTCPAGVTFKSGFHSNTGIDCYAAYQTFTASEWSKLKSAGAVFLPAAGYRYGSGMGSVRRDGFYWSATEFISGLAYYLGFDPDGAGMYDDYSDGGHSVRLVKDLMMTISASAQFDIYCSDGNVIMVDSISMVAPEEPEEPTPPAGIGSFSVSATKKVTFSPGNLQYHPANNKWRFAPSQLDYIGDANSNCSSTYNGWLDLFGWSTSATNFGVSTSTDDSDYAGSFVDWGTNKIGNDAPNTWRTLSDDEWCYLRHYRTNAHDLVGVAQVNGVNGLILLPDSWTCPSGVTFKSGFHSNYGEDYYAEYQIFTAEQWSKLEAAGAVFLPAAGLRSGTNVYNEQRRGFYWSATEYNGGSANELRFASDLAYMSDFNRYYGQSVRLVKDL